MSGLGYALLHPVQIETTAGEYPWKQRFDDGVDVVASVVGAGDLSAYSDAFERELELQLGDLAGQVSALAGPGGPFEFFTRLGDLVSGDVDLAALLRQAGDFLCNLDVTVSTGLIVGLFDRVRDGLSFTEPVDLAHRVRALTEAALGVLEQPLSARPTWSRGGATDARRRLGVPLGHLGRGWVGAAAFSSTSGARTKPCPRCCSSGRAWRTPGWARSPRPRAAIPAPTTCGTSG